MLISGQITGRHNKRHFWLQPVIIIIVIITVFEFLHWCPTYWAIPSG